jgi:predicted DNA-binding transcriptional regulator YafY
MSRPTARVLAILELLQTHGGLAGSELARRVKVDPRTVRRYVVTLEELGIPITAERGRDGRYTLVSGFKLPPMMFTDDEALALAVGLQAARRLGLAEAEVAVSGALAKLERVMPAALKRHVRAVGETVAISLSGSTPPPGNNLALKALSEAAQTETRVHMRYRAREGEETERDFDAYGLAYRGGCWYAVGWCHLRRGLRSFRLDRVEAVRPLALNFERPPGFDALSHLTLSMATLPRAFAVEVLLQTDLQSAQRELSPTVAVLEWTAEGVLLRGQVDSLPWFARELARLPFAFEIRKPAALRRELANVARRLLKIAERRAKERPHTEPLPSSGEGIRSIQEE